MHLKTAQNYTGMSGHHEWNMLGLVLGVFYAEWKAQKITPAPRIQMLGFSQDHFYKTKVNHDNKR